MTARSLLLLLPLTLSQRAAAQLLPDLRAEIDESISPLEVDRDATVSAADVEEGCAGSTTGRTLVRFTLTTANQGAADVVLGDPGCPTCDVDPPPACMNPLFQCSLAEGHHHPHFSRYALYEILPRADSPAVAAGHKQGFCIEDTLCQVRKYNCHYQGLSLGCRDAYFNFLGCQYVDVTDLPNGRYLLRATVNYAQIIPESNYDNNSDQKPVEFCDAIQSPFVHLLGAPGRGGRWSAGGHVGFAKRPLLDADPLRDGALVRLTINGSTPLEVAIPPGSRGAGCGPEDGWLVLPDGRSWFYQNASGFLDGDCAVLAGGIQHVRILETVDGFAYEVQGRLTESPANPPASVDVTVVVGRETGPCGSGRLQNCRTLGLPGHDVLCVGGPAAAAVTGP